MSPKVNWPPAASLAVLRGRAALLGRVRQFMHDAGFLEVETPLLSRAGSPELHLDSFRVPAAFPDGSPGWLITSPEYHLKRVLAAGAGDVYSIAHVFRGGETGRLHNPEFTLLEWYRSGADLCGLMDDIEALLLALLPEQLCRRVERLSYREALRRCADVDPFSDSLARLQQAAEAPEESDRDALLDRIVSMDVYPRLGQGGIALVYDFPASQASLARIRPGNPSVAERVEAVVAGVELVNGFVELLDAKEQRWRLEQEVARRVRAGRETPAIDERFLAALEAGLPPCAGAALGFDRLAMLALDTPTLSEVTAFPQDRA